MHNAYVAEVDLGADAASAASTRSSARRSATRSTPRERRGDQGAAHTRLGERVSRAGSRGLPASGSRRRDLARSCAAPTFDNSIGVLELDERAARVTISRSGGEEEDGPALAQLHTRELSGGD